MYSSILRPRSVLAFAACFRERYERQDAFVFHPLYFLLYALYIYPLEQQLKLQYRLLCQDGYRVPYGLFYGQEASNLLAGEGEERVQQVRQIGNNLNTGVQRVSPGCRIMLDLEPRLLLIEILIGLADMRR